MDHGLSRCKQSAMCKQGFLPLEMFVYVYNNPNVYKTNHNGRPILSNNIIVRIMGTELKINEPKKITGTENP